MNKSTSKLGVITGTVVALALAAAGCGQSTGNASNQPGGDSASGVGKPITVVPAPYGSFQDNFNPFQYQTTANAGTFGLIYEPLFYYSLVSPNVYSLLGKSQTWSNGNKTLTVQLNTNAKWSDGTPFTSKDVVFTFNLLKKYPTIDTSGIWTKLSDVQAQGDGTVVFTFKQPDVPFGLYVVQEPIVPEHIWSSVGDPSKYLNSNPVGTGPYVLESFSAQDYKLKANPNYYLGKPPVPEINFPAYNSNDSANLALAQGTVDWGGQFINNIDNVYASKSPNNKYWFPPNNVVSLVPNLMNPILSQEVVRKAMSLAINRDDLAKKGEYGYVDVASPTTILPTNKDWIDPNLPTQDQQFTYDLNQATQLLESNGYKKVNGVFQTPDGKPLKFSLAVVSGWTDWDEDAQLIQQNLQQLGISVDVQQMQYAGYEAALQSHKFDLAIASSGGGPNPYYIDENVYQSHGSLNYEQWNDPATDQAFAQFESTTDETKQKQAMYTIERTVAEKLPTIPLFYGGTWYEYNTSKYTGWPSQDNPYVSPAPWSWPAAGIVLMHLKPVNG
ncbi:peptide ABC transporter substrate-binding protein [Alicyclobacillus contaminans]|uniref:ABC transporter substrate-binding protein n=1 Tax=Alicyclobacillus contaminans TaxID=392016 RepID=UPI00040BD689|nr:ABC transporter substrate-binding protein [Alicyclobacillus contaminans]GMA51177.1 peptide ABC transporter substrate-binding protein [Alicyclobacillus contaminans]